MTDSLDRSRKALSLFDAWVDLPSDERSAELTKLATTDPALHAELSALFAADAGQGLLEKTAISLLPQADTEPDVPARIGPWRITGVAGRGGMGAVYLGERDDGQFEQRAALKLIRTGMDTPQLRARFLRERQILAALKHPHIAVLLDGGVTESGAPYFAMERVDGQPIDAWCDVHQASLRQRIELVVQICAAVQHAHQNLIVHRDLKPSNVLIDAEGRVKLLDFGIAKLVDRTDGTEGTFERPHTPGFAAPEQINGGAITTATDVYGLGVVLFWLLAGRGPKVPEETLVRVAAQATDAQAQARGVGSPRLLARSLGGDLNAIVSQCLRDEPAQRYGSAGALALDLTAWLRGAPVTARTPTVGYVLRKFVLRHRWGVAAALVATLSLLGGTLGVWWEAQRAERAAREAEAQLSYLRSVLDVLAPSTADARELNRSKLVASAAQKAREALAAQPASLSGVELQLAQVAQSSGDAPQALELAEAARKRREQLYGAEALPTLEAQVRVAAALAEVKPPRIDEAGALLDRVIELTRRLAPQSELLVDAIQKRSTLYGDHDQFADQERVLTEAVALCEGPLGKREVCEQVWLEQGSIASRNRQGQQALAPLRRAWEARRARLGDEHAATLQVAAVVAFATADSGDLKGGLALAEAVHAANQRIYTQPTETSLRAQLRLARLLKRVGEYERSEKMIDDYLATCRRLFGEKNPNTILGESDRASLLFGLGRYDEAEQGFTRAAEGYRAANSEVNAALTAGYAGDAAREAGRAPQAIAGQQAAIATLRKGYPGGENVMLARALTNLGLTLVAAGQAEAALPVHDEAVAMMKKLQPGGGSPVAYAEAMRAAALFELHRGEEAEQTLRDALATQAAVKEASPNQYWEPFAILTRVACANHAADCASLRDQARTALTGSLSAATRVRLEQALASP